jgi:PAS domain-containing protein
MPMEGRRQMNLVLILARGFASKLATATFVSDENGDAVYYNEAAERILGQTFAEGTRTPKEEWATTYQTEELDGTPMPLERNPAGVALLERRPAHHRFRMTGLDGVKRELSVTAIPLLASQDDLVGMVAVFWEHHEE